MAWWILVFTTAWLTGLFYEAAAVRRARKKFDHVIHVNGTRGKSTVSRMIAAGLKAGGLAVFCKTTGTDPMTIDVMGCEEAIARRGRANIKEQIKILLRAEKQGAKVLVVECMAIQPELQYAAQHKILQADVGVITNVRRDHTDVMGTTLEEIGTALSNTVPKSGVLFTAERENYRPLERRAANLGSEFHLVCPIGTEPDFDFPENIALALAVCQALGVDRETALRGIEGFRRDPYALSLHRLGRALFINGLSINDVCSTCMVYDELNRRYGLEGRELILVVNNRGDRSSRTQDMLEVCRKLAPQQVWLLGASQGYMTCGIRRKVPGAVIRNMRSVWEIRPKELKGDQVLFAVGNVAHDGRALMTLVREEGTELV